MYEKVKKLINTATIRQSGITFVGTILNGALGAVFYILAARALGPSGFGVMSVALSVAMLASSISDLGTDTGVVRFVSYYLPKDKKRAYRFLKLTFKTKLTAGLFVSLTGIILSEWIAQVFQKPELTTALRIAFLAVLFNLLYGFVTSYLKAIQKFFFWSSVQVAANLVRLLMILALFLWGHLSVETSIGVYVLTLFLGFVVGTLFLVPKDFFFVKNEKSVAKELFHYNKWIASFTIITALSSRLDTFISARLLTSVEIGIYSAANQLVYIVPQIVGALGTVIAPKLAGMEEKKMTSYLKKTQLLVLGLAFLGLLCAPIVALFVPYIFGSQYLASIPPFYILLLAMLIFLIAVPVHNVILYYYSYPRLFLWLAIGHFLIIGMLGWFMISNFGMIGAAVTVLVGSIFNFVVPGIWVLLKLRK